MEAVLGSFAWHAGAVETVRALGLETSIALAVFLVVVLVVTGVCIVHEVKTLFNYVMKSFIFRRKHRWV